MRSTNRRSFLGNSLAAGAVALVLPSRSWGKASPNETMQLGIIGTGRMGHGDMKNALAAGMKSGINARMVAVCDVDSTRAEHAMKEVEKFYKDRGESRIRIDAHGDFRELLRRPDIDAVVISTPEHWHGIIGAAAADAGKHVYLQKPLTYSIPEGKRLVSAVRRSGVVLQTGSQQRSSVYFRQVCTIIRNQWLGKLEKIEVEIPTDKGKASAERMRVPRNLDYEMWLGPCPEVPYTEARVHPSKGYGRPGWLQIERHCLGMITGWGSHMYDIAQWAMGTDHDSGPVEISSTGEFPDRGLFDVHVGYKGEALYANGVRMTSKNGSPGVRFLAENGWAYCSRGKFDCSDRGLLRRKPADNELTLYQSSDHMADFLAAARSGKDPVCPVEVGHRSNTICVLHHLSMKLGGRKIRWDPEKQAPVDDAEVASMINVPMRPPWKI